MKPLSVVYKSAVIECDRRRERRAADLSYVGEGKRLLVLSGSPSVHLQEALAVSYVSNLNLNTVTLS